MLNIKSVKKVYLVGIGGVGMTPLALYLKEAGFDVTGSDIRDFRLRRFLTEKGIKVTIGHSSENVPLNSVLIYSNALNSDNIELLTAKEHNIPILSRIEALKVISQDKRLIAVTGSYGKSTVTSFISAVLGATNFNPSWIIGADLFNFNPARKGYSDLFVLECDESKQEFLDFKPFFVVLTNIGSDHLSNYGGSRENLYLSIFSFLKKVSKKGKIFLNADDPASERISVELDIRARIIKCGKKDNSHYIYRLGSSFFDGKKIVTSFSIEEKGETSFSSQIDMAGERNVLDACFAYAVLVELGLSKEVARDALRNLPILDRRFEIKQVNKRSIIIDDEGDSPDVIENVLKDARYYFPLKRILSIVQPHRYSRLKSLFSEYVRVLSNYSDDIILTPIYEASEDRIEGFNSFSLGDFIKEKSFGGEVRIVSSLSEAVDIGKIYLAKDYVIITLGPGDIWRVADELTEK